MPSNPSARPATVVAQNSIPWRERPFQTVQGAAVIIGVSPASIYLAAGRGDLRLKKLAGRTLVETASLVAYADTAKDWSPSKQSGPAVSARAARAAQART